MGSRKDDKTYVKAQVSVAPDLPEIWKKLRVRLTKDTSNPPVPLGDGSVSGNVASVWITTPQPITPFFLLAWIDENNNGKVDQNERFYVSDAHIRSVSSAQYHDSRTVLEGSWLSFGWPTARSLLQSFINGTTPSGASSAYADIFVNQPDHNIGVMFLNSQKGRIPKYIFKPDTDVSKRVVDGLFIEDEFIQQIDYMLGSIQCDVLSYFSTNPNGVYKGNFKMDSTPIRFNRTANLFYAFGTTDIIVPEASFEINNSGIAKISISGSLSDLYDWNYEKFGFNGINFSEMAASVQAGFGTLDRYGEIFWLKVIFKGTHEVPFTPNEDQCDTDNDGIPNDEDNCPDTYNPDQADRDGDGVGDACDAFPDDPSESKDSDGDGLGDNSDPCPHSADCDGDGIPDGDDPCPQNPDPECRVINPDPTFIQASARLKSTPAKTKAQAAGRGLVARISLPYEDALVRGDVPIFGVACGSQFKSYRVEIGEGREPAQWTTLVASTTPQETDPSPASLVPSGDESMRGNLATWDTGLKEYVYLPSHPADHPVDLKGVYTVRLVVEGTDGSTADDRAIVEVANVISNAWGGQATSRDALMTLAVPEQALTDAFRLISVKEADHAPAVAGPGRQLVGKVYEVREVNETFTKPATLQFSLAAPYPADLDPNRVGIYAYDQEGKRWTHLKSNRREGNDHMIFSEVARFAAYYALMTSDSPEEGSLAQYEATDHDPASVVRSLANGSGGPHLVNNTFETSLGEWSGRDGEMGAQLSLVEDATYDSTKALRIGNRIASGTFGVNMIAAPFDVRDFAIVQFDYRIPFGLKTNILVKAAGRWYEVGFTGKKKDLINTRVNIAHIGDIDQVVSDDQWHSARFNLYDMLRTQTGNTVIQEMIMANWEVAGYMRLKFGQNDKDAAYYVDNFMITRDLSAGAGAAESTIVVDTFNQKKDANLLGGRVALFGNSPSGKLQAAFSSDDANGKGHSLQIVYDLPEEQSFAGYISYLPNLDLRSFQTLKFKVKGEEHEDFLIGLIDAKGRECKLRIGPYLSEKISSKWQAVSIPLVAFAKEITLSNINGLSLCFEQGLHPAGNINVDDLSFDKQLELALVNRFEHNDERNLLSGYSTTYAYGDSAINSQRAKNSPNGILRISYGGRIGEIFGVDRGYNYAGWTTDLNGINVSPCRSLSFRVKGADGGEAPNIYLGDGSFRWGVSLNHYAHLSTDWQTVSIPLTDFARYGVDLTHLTEMQVVFEWSKMSGTIFVDDVQFR